MKGRVGRCRFTISLLLVVQLLLLTSCSSWQQTRARSEPVARQEHYPQLRAHLVGGSVVTLRDPWFAGDTLYGWREAQPQESGTQHMERDSVAIPIAQVAKLEARHFSALKTTGCVVGVVGALLAVGLAALAHDPINPLGP